MAQTSQDSPVEGSPNSAGSAFPPDSEKGNEAQQKTIDDDDVTIEPYTIFTKRQKLWISLLASFAGMFSTLSSYIYYPAIVPISNDLNSTVFLINLTVTSYLVVAAVAPAFMGDMADQSGRRPIYILMFVLMISANAGMAVQSSFPALLVLRMLQAAGSSGLIAVAFGVIADITQAGERGGYVGMYLLSTDVAVSFGPVLGGGIAQALGWRWIFWVLVIWQACHFLLMLLFFPETQRNIVGNGSHQAKGIYFSLISWFQHHKGKATLTAPHIPKPGRRYPNPFACLPILGDKGSLAVICVYAMTYAVKMTLQTSLGSMCAEIYGLDELAAGLIYLPSGVAGGLGALTTGRYLNWNYRRSAAKMLAQQGGVHAVVLPIERIRLSGMYVLIGVSVLGTIGYGISLMMRAHLAVTLVMQFLTGVTTASIFAVTGTLLTDWNVDRSASAQGALSLLRGGLAGGAIAALEPIAGAIGHGWCFGLYSILMVLQIPLVLLLCRHGPRWRANAADRTSQSR